VLILGGTGEARELAEGLLAEGLEVVTSLAGVTQTPSLPPGGVRIGGFGGEEGLLAYLRVAGIGLIADATHPYARNISWAAHAAARRAGIPYCRLERPPWQAEESDRWLAAESFVEAAGLLPDKARVFLTVGRKETAPFMARSDLTGVARMIEPPAEALPEGWRLVLARPPFTVESELQLMAAEGISHLVCKNAGGEQTRSKLLAARERKIPVVVISRPTKPEAPSFWPVESIIPAIQRLLSP
jgi:precorrin-6A/cobalt-precorrin-6A reductase